jgi:hypothetical protein
MPLLATDMPLQESTSTGDGWDEMTDGDEVQVAVGEHASSTNAKLYCYCRRPFTTEDTEEEEEEEEERDNDAPGGPMLQCDRCQEWYHIQCLAQVAGVQVAGVHMSEAKPGFVCPEVGEACILEHCMHAAHDMHSFRDSAKMPRHSTFPQK